MTNSEQQSKPYKKMSSVSTKTGAHLGGNNSKPITEDQLQFRAHQTIRQKKIKVTLPKMPWNNND